MSDREVLSTAFREAETVMADWQPLVPAPYLEVILTAARERLAQLPETCGTCGGDGTLPSRGGTEREYLEGLNEEPCPSCHGKGYLYEHESVALIARAILSHRGKSPVVQAVAVLDAINDFAAGKPGREG